MAGYTKEQIKKANELDLKTYFEMTAPNEIKNEGSGHWRGTTHSSLVIFPNGGWTWFKEQKSGKSALSYLVDVEKMSFMEAMSKINSLINLKEFKPTFKKTEPISNEKKKLVLPKPAKNSKNVLAYLSTTRGLDFDIVCDLLRKGYIYQSEKYNNVVFLGFDKYGNKRYAGWRGTNKKLEERTGKSYRGDCDGSDKSYGFSIRNETSNTLHIFESPIDLISYLSIEKATNKQWGQENYLSLCGVVASKVEGADFKIPKSLTRFLKENSNINRLVLRLDNDAAGRFVSEEIKNSLQEKFNIIDKIPAVGKDYNDTLIAFNNAKPNEKNISFFQKINQKNEQSR